MVAEEALIKMESIIAINNYHITENMFPWIRHYIILIASMIVSLLPPHVQVALPKELPATPTKFLTGACLTRSEDLWVTAEAGGVYRLSGQEMKPKWEDMRKQPGFPKTDNCQSITKQQQLETSPDQHPLPSPAD